MAQMKPVDLCIARNTSPYFPFPNLRPMLKSEKHGRRRTGDFVGLPEVELKGLAVESSTKLLLSVAVDGPSALTLVKLVGLYLLTPKSLTGTFLDGFR
jgi:hypothetical protein